MKDSTMILLSVITVAGLICLFPKHIKVTLSALWKIVVWLYKADEKIQFAITYVFGILFFIFGFFSNSLDLLPQSAEKIISTFMILDGFFLWSFLLVFFQEILGVVVWDDENEESHTFKD